MNLLRRVKSDPRVLIPLGMVFLALAVAWPRYIVGDICAGWSEKHVDGLRGFLFGIAIGLNFVAIRLIALSRRGPLS